MLLVPTYPRSTQTDDDISASDRRLAFFQYRVESMVWNQCEQAASDGKDWVIPRIAFACSFGKHRSVACALIAARLFSVWAWTRTPGVAPIHGEQASWHSFPIWDFFACQAARDSRRCCIWRSATFRRCFGSGSFGASKDSLPPFRSLLFNTSRCQSPYRMEGQTQSAPCFQTRTAREEQDALGFGILPVSLQSSCLPFLSRRSSGTSPATKGTLTGCDVWGCGWKMLQKVAILPLYGPSIRQLMQFLR